MWMSPGWPLPVDSTITDAFVALPLRSSQSLTSPGTVFWRRGQRTHGRGALLLLGLDDEDLGGLGVDGADHLARRDGGGGVEQRELRLPLGGGEDVLDRLVLLLGVGEDALGLALLLGVLLRLPQAADVLARMPLRAGHGGRPVLALVEDAPDLGLAVGRLVGQPRDQRARSPGCPPIAGGGARPRASTGRTGLVAAQCFGSPAGRRPGGTGQAASASILRAREPSCPGRCRRGSGGPAT